MLEMALGFMPFIALVLGLADFAMVIYINSTLQNAVREGVRQGITYNLTYNGTTYGNQTDVVRAAVEANSGGWLTAANGPTYIRVNYYTPGNLNSAATTTYNGQGQALNQINAPGNVLEVRVQGYPWNWMVPLPNFMPGAGMTLSMSFFDVLQGLPVGVNNPPAP